MTKKKKKKKFEIMLLGKFGIVDEFGKLLIVEQIEVLQRTAAFKSALKNAGVSGCIFRNFLNSSHYILIIYTQICLHTCCLNLVKFFQATA